MWLVSCFSIFFPMCFFVCFAYRVSKSFKIRNLKPVSKTTDHFLVSLFYLLASNTVLCEPQYYVHWQDKPSRLVSLGLFWSDLFPGAWHKAIDHMSPSQPSWKPPFPSKCHCAPLHPQRFILKRTVCVLLPSWIDWRASKAIQSTILLKKHTIMYLALTQCCNHM